MDYKKTGRIVTALAVVSIAAGAYFYNVAVVYPDVALTPGRPNAQITQENIFHNICNRGEWTTKTIRPPASYTNKLKLKQIEQYGYKDKDPKNYEEDHLIPLTVGGDPTNEKNLWPQPYKEPGAHEKDKLEVLMNKKVCKGELMLKEAQKILSKDWYGGYKKYILQDGDPTLLKSVDDED